MTGVRGRYRSSEKADGLRQMSADGGQAVSLVRHSPGMMSVE